MKLYYSPGACSLAPHIALNEAGLAHDAVKVDLVKHALADGTDFYKINAKGYVPVLELDDGKRLTAERLGLGPVHDRAPAQAPSAFGLECLARHAKVLDRLP